jgi:hypothetical protein
VAAAYKPQWKALFSLRRPIICCGPPGKRCPDSFALSFPDLQQLSRPEAVQQASQIEMDHSLLTISAIASQVKEARASGIALHSWESGLRPSLTLHCTCAVEPAVIGLRLLDAAVLPRCSSCHAAWQEYNAAHNGGPAVSVIASAPENLQEAAALSHGQSPPDGPSPPIRYSKMSPKLASQATAALAAADISKMELVRRLTYHRPDLFVFEEVAITYSRLTQLLQGKVLREEFQQPVVKAVKEWLDNTEALTAPPAEEDSALRILSRDGIGKTKSYIPIQPGKGEATFAFQNLVRQETCQHEGCTVRCPGGKAHRGLCQIPERQGRVRKPSRKADESQSQEG